MKIVNGYPPNIEAIRAVLGAAKTAVFTYGDTIFNPAGGTIDPALMKHEETHAEQQNGDPESWWKRYLVDPEWRAQQEVEAYRVQYKAFKKLTHDRNRRFIFLHKIASDLAGPMYGNVMSFKRAFKSVKHGRVL